MIKIPDPLPSGEDGQGSQAIADRFRHARELSALSRAAFCAKHELNSYTVQSWELGRTSFSRMPNVTKFCEALAVEGIICTEDWLIDGIGPAPYLTSALPKMGIYAPPITPRQLKKKSTHPYENIIQKEISLFCDQSHEQDGVVIQIPDEAMAPDYEVGETVGGVRIPSAQVSHFHQAICLIEVKPHHFLIRRLLKEGDAYILLAINKDYPLIRLDGITSIAEIVWHRRIPKSCMN